MNATYRQDYSDEAFWQKIRTLPRNAGRTVLEQALLLFALLTGPQTPAWAKTAILAALGYLVCPIDAVPDFLPGIGYGDDLAVMAALLAELASLIDDDVRRRARELMPESLR